MKTLAPSLPVALALALALSWSPCIRAQTVSGAGAVTSVAAGCGLTGGTITGTGTIAHAGRLAFANADANNTIAAATSYAPIDKALTAARTWTLPAAAAVAAGCVVTIADEVNGVSATDTLTVQRAGSDTIDGATTATIAVGYGSLAFKSDGASRWTLTANTTLPNLTSGQIYVGSAGNLPAPVAMSGDAAISNAGAVTLVNVAAPQGRLTLQSGVPVMTTTQSGKTTLYYAAYKGGARVPYYNGTADAMDTIAANQVGDALPASGAGVVNAGGVFDEYYDATQHGICHVTNGSGGGWASDSSGSNTARGTGYAQLDLATRAFATNKNALAHCYNGATDYGAIAANEGTYLGTFKTDASTAGTVNWVYGSSASGGGAAEFGICNYYNKAAVATLVEDSAASWSGPTTGWAALDAGATGSGLDNRVTYVSCNGEDGVGARLSLLLKAGTNNAAAAIGIGVDSASAPSGMVGWGAVSNGTQAAAFYDGAPGAGLHYLQALDYYDSASNTPTFYGSASVGSTTAAPTVEALGFAGQM